MSPNDALYAFLDAAPVVRTEDIGGAKVPVTGLTPDGLAAVLRDIPALRDALMDGGTVDAEALTVSVPALLQSVPGALAAVLAAGIGRPRDPAAIAWASRLVLAQQLRLLNAVIAETLDGLTLGEFIAEVGSLTALLGVKAKVPASTAPAPAESPVAPEPPPTSSPS